jgi:hypothetical protein
MFWRMSQHLLEIERQSWEWTKARGKARFVRREMLGSLFLWSCLVIAFALFHRSFSRAELVAWCALLPIFLVHGYLSAGWKWKDLEKKFPE